MGFYVESVDRPPRSGIVAVDIDVGEVVAYDASGNFVLYDAASHVEEDFVGVVDFHQTGDAISVDDDDNTYGTFHSADNDRASAYGDEDGGVIKVKTIENTTDGVTTSPTISDGDIVGVVDTSNADAPDSAGRIVEEGYTNDEDDDTTTVTFNRSNGNFIAIGRADRIGDDVTAFDSPVRVQVIKGLN